MRLRIKETRLRHEKSQRAVSEISGIPIPTISALENGKGNPTVETLDRLARAIGCHVTDFFEGRQTPESRDLAEAIVALPEDEQRALLAYIKTRSPGSSGA